MWRSCPISPSGDRLKRTACRLANCLRLAHAGLAMLTSRAVKRGHGIHADTPPSSVLRAQCTERSPLMENGRPIAVLTLLFNQGLARFQSNSAMNTIAIMTSAINTLMIQRMLRLTADMLRSLRCVEVSCRLHEATHDVID